MYAQGPRRMKEGSPCLNKKSTWIVVSAEIGRIEYENEIGTLSAAPFG